jgi:hypothetical protein
VPVRDGTGRAGADFACGRTQTAAVLQVVWFGLFQAFYDIDKVALRLYCALCNDVANWKASALTGQAGDQPQAKQGRSRMRD